MKSFLSWLAGAITSAICLYVLSMPAHAANSLTRHANVHKVQMHHLRKPSNNKQIKKYRAIQNKYNKEGK